MQKKNTKSKHIGRNWLKKNGYKCGLYGYTPPAVHTHHACYMNQYRKGKLERLLRADINE